VLVFLLIIATVLTFTFTLADSLSSITPEPSFPDMVERLRNQLSFSKLTIALLRKEVYDLRFLAYSTKPPQYDLIIQLLDKNISLSRQLDAFELQNKILEDKLEGRYWDLFRPDKEM